LTCPCLSTALFPGEHHGSPSDHHRTRARGKGGEETGGNWVVVVVVVVAVVVVVVVTVTGFPRDLHGFTHPYR